MSNPFYNPFGAPQINNGLDGMLEQIKANPVQFLARNNVNIPNNVPLTGEGILDYLLSSGRITQTQINSAYPILSNLFYSRNINGGLR